VPQAAELEATDHRPEVEHRHLASNGLQGGDASMMTDDFSGMGLLWMILMAIIFVIPFWRICQKAGYPGVLSLLILIPLLNIVFFYFLAFARWPIERKTLT
jgi:hypothetical protein